jgi:hypothetical protein
VIVKNKYRWSKVALSADRNLASAFDPNPQCQFSLCIFKTIRTLKKLAEAQAASMMSQLASICNNLFFFHLFL